MDRKLVRNYLYSILYQLVVKILMPVVLVPYTLSHIGAETLGIYNFAGSIMNWFILFGILGVNTYGNREIAKVRNNKEDLNRTFFEIFYMQLCNMCIAMIAYYLFIQATVKNNLFYYQLTGFTMIATMLDITWFFYGVEDFKKASIRNTVVKCLGVFLIMTFVKTPEDLWLFIVINIGAELFGQAIMFIQLRQYISFEKVSLLDAYRHHFHATFQLFIPTIAISVYTMFDETMIGYLYSEEHVTLYRTSMQIVKMFLYFITSIGAVVLPRVTNTFYNDEHGSDKAKQLISTTMKIAWFLAFPMCFGMMAVAPNFISWYIKDYPIISQLIMFGCPIIILISISNVTGTQYMVPFGMYHQYSTSVVMGSIVNFCFNWFMIPKYGAFGAIMGSVVAECTVTSIQLFFVQKQVSFHFFSRPYFTYIIASFLMGAIVYQVGRFTPHTIPGTLLQVVIGMAVYAMIMILTKDELAMKVIHSIQNWRGTSHA